MSFAPKAKFPKTLATRLTLWYTIIFSISLTIIFMLIYSLMEHNLLQNIDETLRDYAREFQSDYIHRGPQGLRKEILAESDSQGHGNILIRVFNRKGNLVYASDDSDWGKIAFPDNYPQKAEFMNITSSSNLQIRARAILFPVGSYFCQTIISQEEMYSLLERVREAFGWGFLITFLLAVYAGWFMARRSCKHLERMNTIASSIAKEANFSKRVPIQKSADEIDRLAQTLNFLFQRIENLMTEMTNMIDNVAHDIRTPLTRIRMLAEMGSEEISREAVLGNRVQIMEECDYLLGLMNTILNISEAKVGLIKLDKVSIGLKDFLRELSDLFELAAQSKKIELLFKAPDIVIWGDRERLKQAVANLISNALKFTPNEGKISVAVENQEDSTAIIVKDTGIGIPPEEIPNIFKRFHRANISKTTPGQGLGLSLAKAYVEAHGGHIEVYSRPGKGSTFSIILPR